MKKNTLFLVTLAVAAFFSACSVSDSEDSEYSKWTFSGTVVDSENGQGLSKVQISYLDSDGDTETAETDEDGNFFIDNLPYGSLNFTFSYTLIQNKDTIYYAPKVLNIGSSGESSRMEGVVAGTALVVRLSPLNAELTGELYINDEDSDKKVPVTKTKVYLAHQDTAFINSAPKNFEATTDSLGRFSFKNLPADTGLMLIVEAFVYKDLRYTADAIELPRLKSSNPTDIGRIYLSRDTLITPEPKIKKSNVMDVDLIGLENVSQLETPYYIFKEELDSKNLSVTVNADTGTFFVEPRLSKDTLFLDHSTAFPPKASISVSIVGYGKKTGDRIAISLNGKSAFTTSQGIYAVTSNTWPSNEKYKAVFGTDDTLWVKFSKELSTNTDRIQWNYLAGVDCSIYANGFYANSNAWIKKDTLFVQMLENILIDRDRGDSVGMNITIYAKDGTYMDGFVLRTELVVPSPNGSSDDDED